MVCGRWRMPGGRNEGWGEMVMRVVLVVLVLQLGIHTTQAKEEQEHPEKEDDITLSACFSSADKVLEARCPPGYMVNILNIFNGHSPNGSCQYQEGDCTQKDDLDHKCVGREICEINLPSGELGRLLPQCDKYSNYMQLSHTCVPGSSVYDICQHSIIHDQRGYIKTPSYPNNYSPGLRCIMKVKAQSSQKIKLHVIDMDLEKAGASWGCADLLYINGTFRGSSLCGERGSEKIFTTIGSELNLNFTSDYKGHNKGFWLYYEAFPYIPPTEAPSTSTSLSTIQTTSTSISEKPHHSVLPPSDATNHVILTPKAQENTTRLPMEAIVGGLLGSLLCILLVLVILLIIKRRKERDAMPSSTSTCFLHSNKPAGVPPGTSGPYIQNNLALVDDSALC